MTDLNDNSCIISIKQHTKMKETIPYCDLKITSNDFRKITLIAEGKAINKAISISEILKNKYEFLDSINKLDSSPSNPQEPLFTIILQKKE